MCRDGNVAGFDVVILRLHFCFELPATAQPDDHDRRKAPECAAAPGRPSGVILREERVRGSGLQGSAQSITTPIDTVVRTNTNSSLNPDPLPHALRCRIGEISLRREKRGANLRATSK